MQAGAHYALADEDWVFPSYRESAIGLLRGHAGRDGPLLVARPSVRLVEPGRLQRGLDRRPDRDAGPARGRPRLGQEAARRERRLARLLRRRRDLRGRLPRGSELRRRLRRPRDPLLQQQPVGDLDADLRADPRGRAGGQGGRLRDPRRARGRRRRARRLRGDARRGRAGARGRRARPSSRRVTYRAAPHATADDPKAYIDLERVEEERRNECVGRYEGYLRRLGVLSDEQAEADPGRGARRHARRDRRRRGRAARRHRPRLRARVRRPAARPRARPRRPAPHPRRGHG